MTDQAAPRVSPSDIAVGVRELRAALATYLDRVSAGATIVINRGGRPVARLSPPWEPSGPVHGLDELARLGLVERPSTGSTDSEPRPATGTRPLPVDVRVDRIVRQVRG